MLLGSKRAIKPPLQPWESSVLRVTTPNEAHILCLWANPFRDAMSSVGRGEGAIIFSTSKKKQRGHIILLPKTGV